MHCNNFDIIYTLEDSIYPALAFCSESGYCCIAALVAKEDAQRNNSPVNAFPIPINCGSTRMLPGIFPWQNGREFLTGTRKVCITVLYREHQCGHFSRPIGSHFLISTLRTVLERHLELIVPEENEGKTLYSVT